MQIVADYSCLVSGAVSKTVKSGEVIIPISVVTLLEVEMKANKADGFVGTSELLSLKDMADKGTIELRFTGQRPRVATKSEADWDARETARAEDAVLMTCDEVQEKISKSMGIEVGFVKQEGELNLSIGKLFDKTTMSVHIKEGLPIFAKKGVPGNERPGEPGDGRFYWPGQAGQRLDAGLGVRGFSRPPNAQGPKSWHVERRGAANAANRQGAHVSAQAVAH